MGHSNGHARARTFPCAPARLTHPPISVSLPTLLLTHDRQALKDRGVAFVVAPYEADAQMAYLALRGDVWAVVTEDSDLLAYGCPRVSAVLSIA